MTQLFQEGADAAQFADQANQRQQCGTFQFLRKFLASPGLRIPRQSRCK
jgi:hypothetical protein